MQSPVLRAFYQCPVVNFWPFHQHYLPVAFPPPNQAEMKQHFLHKVKKYIGGHFVMKNCRNN